MPEPLDETGYSDGRDEAGFQTRKGRPLDAPLDDEDIPRRIVRRTALPGLILATGILWILAGTAYIGLFALTRLLQVPFQTSDIWLLLCAGFFIHDGVQLIRGRFRDPLVDGIFTIGLGLFFFGQGYYQFTSTGEVFALLFGAFFGCVFLVPGVLVLFGRKQYLAWKEERNL